jgi:hypothetical protein
MMHETFPESLMGLQLKADGSLESQKMDEEDEATNLFSKGPGLVD